MYLTRNRRQISPRRAVPVPVHPAGALLLPVAIAALLFGAAGCKANPVGAGTAGAPGATTPGTPGTAASPAASTGQTPAQPMSAPLGTTPTPSSVPATTTPVTPASSAPSGPASTPGATPSRPSPRPVWTLPPITIPAPAGGLTPSAAPPAPTTAPPATVAAPPATVPAPPATGQSAFATAVVAATNQQRRAAGCGDLTVDAVLTSVAQAHSADMATANYFSHNSQDGRTPFDRITAAGFSFSVAAENIAAGQRDPAAVMQAWMNSPGHRANILNCALTRIGVGVANGGTYGVYWTQDFGTPRR